MATVMTDKTLKECVESLARRAEATTHDAGEAMKFAQAASNLANAMCALKDAVAPADREVATASSIISGPSA